MRRWVRAELDDEVLRYLFWSFMLHMGGVVFDFRWRGLKVQGLVHPFLELLELTIDHGTRPFMLFTVPVSSFMLTSTLGNL